MITVVGDVVSVYDYKHPHGLWKLGSTERLPPGADGNERCIFVKVQSNGWFGIFKRPLQWLYPLEVRSVENASSASHMSDDTPQSDTFPSPQGASDSVITAGEPEVKMIWMRTDIWTNFVSNYSIHFFYSVGTAQCASYYGHNFLNLGCHVRGTSPASCKLAKGAEWTVSEHELHQFFLFVLFCLAMICYIQECNLELKLTMLTPCEGP